MALPTFDNATLHTRFSFGGEGTRSEVFTNRAVDRLANQLNR